MEININLIFISIISFSIGLLTGIFSKKFINTAIFVLFLYVSMTALDALGASQNWGLFKDLRGSLADTGTITIKLLMNLLKGMPVAATVFFILGGAIGIISGKN